MASSVTAAANALGATSSPSHKQRRHHHHKLRHQQRVDASSSRTAATPSNSNNSNTNDENIVFSLTHDINNNSNNNSSSSSEGSGAGDDERLVRRQLERALALALDAVGFDEAEPLALASMVALTEEYMARFLRTAARSMAAARRTTPVPLDFQAALAANNLTCRALLPHLDPPVYGPTRRKKRRRRRSSTSSRDRSKGNGGVNGDGKRDEDDETMMEDGEGGRLLHQVKRQPVLSTVDQVLPTLVMQPLDTFDDADHERARQGSDVEPSSQRDNGSNNSNSGKSAMRMTAKQEAILDKILGSNGGRAGASWPSEDNNSSLAPTTTTTTQRSPSTATQAAKPANVPAGFPALPSQHTYRSRAVFALREKDPQRIRERASEEGRLGEEALRRLATKQAGLRKAREEREMSSTATTTKTATQHHHDDDAGRTGDPKAVQARAKTKTTTTTTMTKTKPTSKATAAAAAAATMTTTANTTAAAAAVASRKRKAEAPPFRGRAEGMFKDLMASFGGSEGGEGAGVEGTVTITDGRDNDWNGGLNEPVNSERIYWRQAPKRPAANG